MGVTATRLGLAPLWIDWSHLTAASGFSDAGRDEFPAIWSQLLSRFQKGEVAFYDAPLKSEISQVEESLALAKAVLAQNQFTDCLFLGIGGSALGPISLLGALQERATTPLRLHFMENPDPLEWQSTFGKLSPEKTFLCVVTKSGTTFETIAQFLLALEWLGRARWKSHCIAITDPEKGDLRTFAKLNGIQTLSIHPAMGGRFSVFSPVGFFPAALVGLNVKDFIEGAKLIRDYVQKTPPEKNPLFIIGAEFIRNYPKRPIHVCMPYSSRLRGLGSWFTQLWGESLGKDGKGFTPLSALGATDQHSILQLLRDGPDDKVTLFITLDQVENPVPIPRSAKTPGAPASLASFSLLEGHSLHELLQIEYQATSLVLTRRSRPHLTWKLDRLDERAMGAVYFAFSVLTAFTGTLWQINPFDQPGVEEGKIYTKNALNQQS